MNIFFQLQESYKRLRILGALEENQNLLKKKTKLDHKNIGMVF